MTFGREGREKREEMRGRERKRTRGERREDGGAS